MSLRHQHAVWSTPVPDVTTGGWGTTEWQKFENMHRPKNYYGDRHDQAAWEAYQAAAEERLITSLRLKNGMPADLRSVDNPFWQKVFHQNLQDALREASANAPSYVAYVGQEIYTRSGWVVYAEATPIMGINPQFLCAGAEPEPLTAAASAQLVTIQEKNTDNRTPGA